MKKYIAFGLYAASIFLAAGVSLNVVAQINPAVMPISGPLSKQTMTRLLLTDAARFGNRVVAVGDRGYIVYSENNGESWQRAQTPPNTPLLTAIYLVGAQIGWAVGHDSTILTSTDQGLTWTKAFSAADELKPLMDITFLDPNIGFAVGAYGAFYATTDGGKTWTPRKLFNAPVAAEAKPVPAKGAAKTGKYESVGVGKEVSEDASAKGADEDKHLNAIIKLVDAGGAKSGESKLFVAGEAGMLAKSDDAGKTWTRITSPYKGSFFGAIQCQDGAVLVFGLRGRIYRSADPGLSVWTLIETKSTASLMGSTRLADGAIVLAGLSGTVLISRDNGQSFSSLPSGSTKALSTPVLGAPSALLLAGEAGVREILLTAAAPAPASAPAAAKP